MSLLFRRTESRDSTSRGLTAWASGDAIAATSMEAGLRLGPVYSAVSLVAGRVGGLLEASVALPVEAFNALGDAVQGVTAVAADVAQVATAFAGARAALEESAGWLQSGDPLAVLSSAADRAGQAVWFADQAGASLSKLAARVAVRGDDLGGVAV